MKSEPSSLRAFLVVAAWACVAAGASAQCGVKWSNQFDAAFFPNEASAMVTHDDGTGPALYVGSRAAWNSTGNLPLSVVRYRGPGLPLETVGGGMNGSVSALAVYDDGTGPALYATGDFSTAGGAACNRIAKWNGTAWSPLGSGLDAIGYALAVFDDGAGPALFVGGEFSNAGGVAAARLAKWNGSSWTGNPSIVPSYAHVRTLAVFNPGTGNRLYVAGQFTSIGGTLAANVASFNGLTFFPLGSGFSNPSDFIGDIQVYDPGTGAQLYACGWFANAGGVPANGVARWNGTAWSALGSGIDGIGHGLCVWNTAAGPRLVVGGQYTSAGGIFTGGVALFDGSAWSSVNAQGRTATVVGTFNPGSGEQLYTVGTIGYPGPTFGGGTSGGPTWYVLQSCLGTTWTAPTGHGIAGTLVAALESHDDGSGQALYAAGDFHEAGGTYANGVARWNGSSWSPVGAPPCPGSSALKSFDDGTGPALYCLSSSLQKWNGTTWTIVGPAFDSWTSCLAAYDAGAGPSLYAGGYFAAAGGVTLNQIARLSGSTWVPLGSGMSLPSGTPVVSAMTVFDDGTGPALYAGGKFSSAGGVAASNVDKWNGTSWSPLGAGIAGGAAWVQSLAVYDDGTGPALYVGGQFTAAGGIAGVPAVNFAKWNGSSWSSPGSIMGVSSPFLGVSAMRVFDDLTGPKLYLTGNFTHAAGIPATNIARWNGSFFEALGSGLEQPALGTAYALGYALCRHDLPSGPSLFVGGTFTVAGGQPSDLIAEIIPARPVLSITQASPGSGIVIDDKSLKPGLETYNIFSLEPAPGGPGTGPYVGLYATNLAPLLTQFFLPLGAVPFHFTAASPTATFGPYSGFVLSGAVIEGLCFQVSGCISTVSQLIVQ